jgi:hypothetical protein
MRGTIYRLQFSMSTYGLPSARFDLANTPAALFWEGSKSSQNRKTAKDHRATEHSTERRQSSRRRRLLFPFLAETQHSRGCALRVKIGQGQLSRTMFRVNIVGQSYLERHRTDCPERIWRRMTRSDGIRRTLKLKSTTRRGLVDLKRLLILFMVTPANTYLRNRLVLYVCYVCNTKQNPSQKWLK